MAFPRTDLLQILRDQTGMSFAQIQETIGCTAYLELRDEFAMAATPDDLKPFTKKFFVKDTQPDGAFTRIVDVECETPTYEARYLVAPNRWPCYNK